MKNTANDTTNVAIEVNGLFTIDKTIAVVNPAISVANPVITPPFFQWNTPNINGNWQSKIVEDRTANSTM